MGLETALMMGGMAAAGMMAAKAFSPKMPSGGGTAQAQTRSVEAGMSDAESRRRQVMQRLERMRKATLLAKGNQAEPMIRKATLGPGQ